MAGKNLVKYAGKLVAEDSRLVFEERCRHLEETTPELLALLSRYNVRLTFFVTGRLYDSSPGMIRSICDAGHEIGWHGHFHRPITDHAILKEELAASGKFLRDFRPRGFRAPWVMFDASLLPMLKDHGFTYDSSMFGPAGSRFETGGVNVFPVTSFPNIGGGEPSHHTGSRYLRSLSSFPAGSNFALSLFRRRYSLFLRGLESGGKGCVLYVHNWQLYPWNARSYSLGRDKLRYLQKFPLADILEELISKHRFYRMDRLLTPSPGGPGHYLTFDME